jgi:hypothetical protein
LAMGFTPHAPIPLAGTALRAPTPLTRPLNVSPLHSPVVVHRGAPREPVAIYVDQPLTAAMAISPPSGRIGSVVRPALFPIVAAAAASAVAAAPPHSHGSHFLCPCYSRAQARACKHGRHLLLRCRRHRKPFDGPLLSVPLASSPSTAAVAGFDSPSIASCDSRGAATMYELSLITCRVATFF